MTKALCSMVVIGVGLTLSACGTDPAERTLSGAAIGAGSGAAIGAAFGGLGVVPGTIIGAAVGGVTGAVTDPRAVDLGRPIYR